MDHTIQSAAGNAIMSQGQTTIDIVSAVNDVSILSSLLQVI